MDNTKINKKFYEWQYYFIIGMVSLIAVFFLPMVGSSAGLEFVFPDTISGWIIYVVTKLCVTLVNIVIFYSFMNQAKINIAHNEKYIEANKILGSYIDEKYNPRSPEKWNKEQYTKKGISLVFGSIAGSISLTQAILVFDWITMITYLFIIIIGLIFGLIQMNNAEEYWTSEYWQYAKLIESEFKNNNNTSERNENKKGNHQNNRQNKNYNNRQNYNKIRNNRGTNLLEPNTNTGRYIHD